MAKYANLCPTFNPAAGMSSGPTTKLFLGFNFDGELRLHWSRYHPDGVPPLHLIEKQGKMFLGRYLEPKQTLEQLKAEEAFLKIILHECCPKIDLDKRTTALIPVTFLS